MNDFTKKLADYGADVETALGRFANDEGLYEKCFYMLVDDPNFAALGTAIADKDYEEAFKAAHAIKGVTGNLELTPLYNAISVIVDDLRSNKYDDIEGNYKTFEEEFEKMKVL